MQTGQHVHTVELNMGTMLDDELAHFGRIVGHLRDRYSGNDCECARPGMAQLFNELLIAASDERRRREREHGEVMDMLRFGDRLDALDIPEETP